MNSQAPYNVLLITTDEQRYDTLGCNGNALIQTPYLDQLAAEGINFKNHTCSSPICTPARASILTGLYPRTCGGWDVGYTIPTHFRGLAHYFSEQGYRTGLLGKAHFEGELSRYAERLDHSKPYYGFDTFHITEDNQFGEYLDWIKQKHPQHWDAVRYDTHGAKEVREKPYPNMQLGTIPSCYTSSVPEHLRQTAWIENQTLEFMTASVNEHKPFFAWCSYVHPHYPWNPSEPYASMYDPSKMPLPARRSGENQKIHVPDIGQDELPDTEYQRMCAAYYAMITQTDASIGRMIAAMKQMGLLENTVILFTSDHGDYNGDHGLLAKGARMYENILKVPFIVRLPNGHRKGQVYSGLTQHEDLLPTILDYVGIPLKDLVQGQSFANVLQDETNGPRKYSFFEHKWHKAGDGAVGVAKGNWKLIYHPKDEEWILVNTKNDPLEYENLSGRNDSLEIERELKEALLHWLLHTPNYRPKKPVIW